MKIRTAVCIVLFYLGLRLGSIHITTGRAIVDGCFFFFGGCWLSIHLDRKDRGYPNEFGIPRRA